MSTPLEEMRTVAKRLQPLEIPFTFIGGAVLGLLVDDPKLSEIRSTKDVDVVVEVVTYGEYMALEERLRQARFQHDTSQGAPICRWIIDGCLAVGGKDLVSVHGFTASTSTTAAGFSISGFSVSAFSVAP